MHPLTPLRMYGVSLVLLLAGTIICNGDGFLGDLTCSTLMYSIQTLYGTLFPYAAYSFP